MDAASLVLSSTCGSTIFLSPIPRWPLDLAFLQNSSSQKTKKSWGKNLLSSFFAQKPVAETDPFTLTAKSANVAQPGSPVKIVVFRWSSEEERNRIVLPLDPAAQAAAQAAASAEGRGRGGRGTRGQAGAAELDPNDPALAEVIARGRGARGRGDAAAKPPDPISEFTAAVGKAPT